MPRKITISIPFPPKHSEEACRRRGDGVVYEIVKGSNAITDLASFNGTNGAVPLGGVTLDGGDNLFGTTQAGGANSDGTVFEIVKGTNTITDLASFNGTNGASPEAGVTFDSSGNLFGTTYFGGANNVGTVFEIAGAAAPEPSQIATLGLLLIGLTALLLRARRRTGMGGDSHR